MNNTLNLMESESKEVVKARAILGDESTLRYLAEEMCWMLIDINKALRPYGLSQPQRRQEIIRRLGVLRVKLEAVGTSPTLADRDLVGVGIADAIKDLSKEAQRRSDRDAGQGRRP